MYKLEAGFWEDGDARYFPCILPPTFAHTTGPTIGLARKISSAFYFDFLVRWKRIRDDASWAVWPKSLNISDWARHSPLLSCHSQAIELGRVSSSIGYVHGLGQGNLKLQLGTSFNCLVIRNEIVKIKGLNKNKFNGLFNNKEWKRENKNKSFILTF